MKTLLHNIEKYGNKIPHPSLMFFYLTALMVLISAASEILSYQAINPITHELVAAKSLISGDGIRYMLTNMVKNFMGFAPLGIVLVAMLGIGIAEKSTLLQHILTSIVKHAKSYMLTFSVAFMGIISSLGADSGYVVLIPMSALLFQAAGRSPIAGIATAFAAVSGGYSANLLVGPIDAVLAGISTEAYRIVDPLGEVTVTANWLFMIVSAFFIASIITAITHYRDWPDYIPAQTHDATPSKAQVSFNSVIIFTVAFTALLAYLTIGEHAILRDPVTGSITKSPFISSLVILISLYFAIAGLLFGFSNGVFNKGKSVILAMEETMATMASYLVMMFFAAQFIAYFAWSNIGLIIAIDGANFLSSLAVSKSLLLIIFILVTAFINLFIGSASAKWALMAPIFIPMLALVNVPPEQVQLAYRIGDSSTNIITPMMPYFALVLAFAQKHDKEAGLGTLMAAMLPYSIAFLIAWPTLFFIWLTLGLPIGI